MISMPLPVRPANLASRYSRIFNNLWNLRKPTAACAVLAGTVCGAWNIAAAQTAQFIGGVPATIPVGNGPNAMAVNPAGSYAYVANFSDNTVSVIATATNTVTATINVGHVPDAVGVNPAGTYVYVANANDNTVSVIATATNTVTATINVGHVPDAVGVNPAGTYVYVANANDSTVSVIATATNTVTTTINVGNSPQGVAVNPAGTNAYVANYGDGTVSVIATATNTVTTTIPVSNGAFAVAVNSAGSYVYVANSSGDTISVIATATNTVTAAIPVGNGPFALAVNPAGSYAYVTVSGGSGTTVSVIDTMTNTVIGEITVGNGANAVVVNPAGTYAYVANYNDNTVSVIALAGVNIGSVNVGSSSASIPLIFAFDTGGTIGAPVVLTQGAANMDFTLASGGTCAAGSYSAGDSCTVNVKFTPKYAGTRYGAAILKDGSGNTIATGYVYGTGTGPQVDYSIVSGASPSLLSSPATPQSTLGSGFYHPTGVAVDANGNVYVADYGDVNNNGAHSAVYEISAGNGTPRALGSGFYKPYGVAVDGAGNVYVGDYGNHAVKEIVAVNGSIPASPTILTLGGSFSSPKGVAVDASGNVYVGNDGFFPAVYEMSPNCASSACVTTLGSGAFAAPQGIAVDGSGNVYVADYNLAEVYEMSPNCTSSACVTTLGSSVFNGIGSNDPIAVAVDGVGNVYVGDIGTNAVYEILAINGSIPASPTINTLGTGFTLTQGVAVDGKGNVYIAENSAAYELDYADQPSLSFATATEVGTTDATDGPKTVTVNNAGNASLTFTVPGTGHNPSYAAGFPENSSDTNLCASGGTVAAGASCDVSANFQPTGAGTNSGSVVLTDNALNVTGATQSISLSGTGLAIAPTTATVSAVSAAYGSTTGITVTATESGSAGVVTGGVVTFGTSGSVGGSFNPTTCALTSGGTCTTTYTPSGTLAAGSYASDITASFAANNNYTSASATSALTINATTPTFGTMSFSPAATEPYSKSQIVTISDTLAYTGSGAAPTGAVTFTLNSVAYIASCTGSSSPRTCTYAVPAATIAALPATAYTVTVRYTADTNYNTTTGTSGTFTITQAAQTISFTPPTSPVTYGVSPIALSATANSGLGVTFSIVSGPGSISGSTLTITGAGMVVVAANQSGNANYTAAAQVTQSITVNNATASVTLGNLTQTYTGSSLSATATTNPTGLTVTFTYNGSSTAPTAAGSYTVVGTINNANYTGSATGTLVIGQATATVTLGSLSQTYTGSPLSTTATTSPTGLAVTFTYNGNATAPTAAGNYTVVGTINNANYTGSATGTMVIGTAALTVTANNASRVYGAANPSFAGSVTGAVNGNTFTESFATTATVTSNVGSYAIVPSATGTNLSDYALNIHNGTLTVAQAGTTASLAVSSASVTPGSNVTLTAQIVSLTSGTPSGTVSFYDSTSQLGTVPLTSGTASYSTTSLSAGATHSLTAVYNGDSNFTTSSSTSSITVTVTPLTFTLNLAGAGSGTVAPGGVITYQFTVTPTYGSYPGTVNFAASGLPPGATATFSPASIASNGGPQTVTVTIQTAAVTAAERVPSPPATPSAGRRLAPFALALLLLFGAGGMRRQGLKLRRLLCVALLLAGGAATAMLSGCGPTNGFFAQQQQTYTITITASSGSLQQTTSFTLNLQ